MKYLLSLLFLLPALIVNGQRPTLGINLEGYEYPYPVHYHTFTSQQQQLQMAYMYEQASSSNGTTVMLLHGKNFNGAYWGQTMKALLDNNYNVFVPDQIGFGKSVKPEYYQYTFQQLAHNTKAILDSLGINKVVVLGHSMGGMLAVRFSLMYPEMVRQLILENPIGLEDWKLKVPYTTIEEWHEQELKKTYEGVKQYMSKSYYDNQWKEKYNEWLYLATASLESPDYRRLAWNSALTYDMIFTQPVVYEFPQIKVPVTLIIGQRDRTALGKDKVSKETAATMGQYPQLGRRAKERIPNAQLIEMAGIGHLPHIEDFDLFIDNLLKALKQ